MEASALMPRAHISLRCFIQLSMIRAGMPNDWLWPCQGSTSWNLLAGDRPLSVGGRDLGYANWMAASTDRFWPKIAARASTVGDRTVMASAKAPLAAGPPTLSLVDVSA